MPTITYPFPSSLIVAGSVANYAALPSPVGKLNQLYLVLNNQGIWLINFKGKGYYISDGATWAVIDFGSFSLEDVATLQAEVDLIKPVVYFNQAVAGNVVENDIVKNAVNQGTGQAPLSFVLASSDADYWAIIGVAKNVSGGMADIHISGRVTGFNFGAFVGVEYYVDPANPGKITWTPPSVADPIKVGRALDATSLILMPHQQRQFCWAKGAIYTSDGHWDDVIAVGANGNTLVANSAQSLGLQWLPAVVCAAPLTYTLATRTLTVAVATNSVAGVLSAADHTTYSGYAATIALKAPLASPVFTGNVNASTGDVLVSTIGKGISVKKGTNAKIGTAVLVAGTVTVANTSITANSLILLTSQVDGGTPGSLRITSKTVGVGFTITSSNVLDTSTVGWVIVEQIP